jgi:hypothetical protein
MRIAEIVTTKLRPRPDYTPHQHPDTKARRKPRPKPRAFNDPEPKKLT